MRTYRTFPIAPQATALSCRQAAHACRATKFCIILSSTLLLMTATAWLASLAVTP